MRKVCVVITARPSYSRIKSALDAIQRHPDLQLQLVVAASALLERYGQIVKEIEADGFTVDAKVYMVVEGENLVTSAKTTGMGLIELATVFDNLKPDVVVTIADRYETIATALAAANMNIPLVHIQGGEVTGSIDEKIRHAVTKLSDFHFVSTQKAAQRVIKMGEHPDKVFVTGCPSIDIASEVLKDDHIDFDPLDRYGGVGEGIDFSKPYCIVMQHPVTTDYINAKAQIIETLQAVHQSGIQAIWFWPNVDAGSDQTSKGIRSFRENYRPQNIWFVKNMVPNDFLKLLNRCVGIIGNSSVAIRECSFLGVPAINVGDRQSGRERGSNVIDVNYSTNEILSAIRQHFQQRERYSDHLYGDGDAGIRIASLISRLELTYKKKLTY